MFKRVRNTLSVLTKGKQTSWEHTSLSGDFFFNLSVGLSIEIYSNEAITDELFHIDSGKLLHNEIQALKSHNYYTQNPVALKLTPSVLNDSDDDAVFVLGRNIYQAACGNARDLKAFISRFREKTANLHVKTRKALLDGMIFEIFFDSKGQIRDSFKTSQFNQVFEYQKYSEFSESFTFISDVLSTYSGRFYAIPGKNREVSVDVSTQINEKDEHKILGVHFSGYNILRQDEKFSLYEEENGVVPYEGIRALTLEQRISEELLIPKHKLKVNYDFEYEPKAKLLYPYGHTIAK